MTSTTALQRRRPVAASVADHRVDWTNAARDDLRAIVWHIAQDNLANALAVAERIDRRAAKLMGLVVRGRVVPELRKVAETRYREVMEEPWRIIYRVEEATVYVVAVVDGRRDVQAWLNERMARFGTARR